MATKKIKAAAKSAKKVVKKSAKKAPAKASKKPAKKTGRKSASYQSVFSPKQSGEKGYPPKRRTPIRNPGKRKPLSERNPNRVAPRIVHKQEPSAEFVEVVPEIKSAIPITSTGRRHDLEPTASPFVITKASPSSAISASILVGLWSVEV